MIGRVSRLLRACVAPETIAVIRIIQSSGVTPSTAKRVGITNESWRLRRMSLTLPTNQGQPTNEHHRT